MANRARPQTLEVAHPNAEGIDIGSGSHFVAVRADLHEEPVREFGSFTEDLESIAAWLTECAWPLSGSHSAGSTSVAIQYRMTGNEKRSSCESILM